MSLSKMLIEIGLHAYLRDKCMYCVSKKNFIPSEESCKRKVDIGNGKHVKLKIFIEKQPHSLIYEGWQWQVFVGHRSDHALAMLI